MTVRRMCAASVSALIAGAAWAAPPAPLPPKPVTETLYGTTVTDPYRYFENDKDPQVTAWLKAQGRYTRSLFDAVPGHAALLARMEAFTGSSDPASSVQKFGDTIFYLDRAPGADDLDLLVRDASGTPRKLVDIGAIRAAHGGGAYAINYFHPSWDGKKVAVALSAGGSEDATLTVYDVASGKPIAGPIPRARFDGVQWTDDGTAMVLDLLNPLAPGEGEIDKYKNVKVYFWDLKTPPVPILGNPLPGPIRLTPDESPAIILSPGSSLALALNINGVQNELEIWTAPAAAATKPGAPWTKLVAREDGVTNYALVGDHLFLLSHKDAPTFKILSLKLGEPLSAARPVVAARRDRLIESIAGAADGLYVAARQGVYSQLSKVPLAGGAEQPVALPAKGSIGGITTDPRVPGALVAFTSWTVWGTTYALDARGGVTDLRLGHGPAGFDASKLVVADLQAKAVDGVAVPLSYVSAAGAKTPRPLLISAYGSYGYAQFPAFATRINFMVGEGVDYATCHVRGGGELGEAWRLGGKDAAKPNTWRDLIACAETLIARGATTRDMLFIAGGSAGGITMGRAMEERPDLFAGVIDEVPVANPLRQEFSPNGPGNIPEFGTVATAQGFANLLAMDSLYHVKDGTQYPAVLITTGLNDPRVPTWEPAKLAARLQTSGTTRPVLLRVDEDAGHGIGSNKTQNDLLYTDILSFIRWRIGTPGWTPPTVLSEGK